MASGTTELDVVNRALVKIGAQEINSLDDSGKNPRIMRAAIDPVRDKFLRKNPWNSAIKRVQIAKNTVAPAWGWASAYDLPSDFIKLLNVQSSTTIASAQSDSKNTPNNIDYKLEGGQILCDETATLNIRYVSRQTDMSRWDPMMTEALASLLAYEVCMAISNDRALKGDLWQEYMEACREAKTNDGWEDDMYDFPEDDWILATL